MKELRGVLCKNKVCVGGVGSGQPPFFFFRAGVISSTHPPPDLDKSPPL